MGSGWNIICDMFLFKGLCLDGEKPQVFVLFSEKIFPKERFSFIIFFLSLKRERAKRKRKKGLWGGFDG